MSELLKKIDYALRKDSLSDAERIASARQLVSQGLSDHAPAAPEPIAYVPLSKAPGMEGTPLWRETRPAPLMPNPWVGFEMLSLYGEYTPFTVGGSTVAPPARSAATSDTARQLGMTDDELKRETVMATFMSMPFPAAGNANAVWEALRELTEACEEDCGVPSEDDEDDEAVGASADRQMALTFGMLRRARVALSAAPTSSPEIPDSSNCSKSSNGSPEPDAVREALASKIAKCSQIAPNRYTVMLERNERDAIVAALLRPAHGGWPTVPPEITDDMRYVSWKAQALHIGASELEAIQMANRRMTPEQRAMDQAAYAAMLGAIPRNDRGSPSNG